MKRDRATMRASGCLNVKSIAERNKLACGPTTEQVAWLLAQHKALTAALAAAREEARAGEAYKRAVDDALEVACIGVTSGDATADLAKLLAWEVQVALDPAVSLKAAGLVASGERRGNRNGEQNFIGYLIDNCEREYITEEHLQRTYADYLKSEYAEAAKLPQSEASIPTGKILAILDGIDREETDGGWWETSTGAEFGAKILDAIRAEEQGSKGEEKQS